MFALRRYTLQRLARAVERLETELVRLDDSGFFVALQKPAIEHAHGEYFRHVRVKAIAAMRTGVAIGIVVDLDVIRLHRTHTYLVIRAEQHFKASIFGEGELLRYESGHRTHKQAPHLHGTWCQARGLRLPDIDTTRAVSLTSFVQSIETWRLAHEAHLPHASPPLGAIRV